jgi:hypothetical protein
MTLSPPEVASIARRLVFWEVAEYVSEALVGLGCFGEYVAEYAKWPASWTEDQKRRLGRGSLVLLICGIVFGIVSLIQTNALSGQVIGSLGEQVKEAGKKVELATDSIDTALRNSEQAKSASEIAKGESTKAQGAASNALALAGGARQEADSFERDIVAAKKQAAEAEAHLAEALRRAAEATVALNRLKSPRSLTNIAELTVTLAQFKDTEYTFSAVSSDQEALQLLKSVDAVLRQAGWKRGKPILWAPAINVFGPEDPYSVPVALNNGVRVSVDWPEGLPALQSIPVDKLPTLVKAAVTLNFALFSNLDPPEDLEHPFPVDIGKGESKTVRIAIGKKP